MLVQQQIIIPLQAQAFTGCNLSLKRSPRYIHVASVIYRHFSAQFCELWWIFQRLKREIRCTNTGAQSLEHFNAKGFGKHSATPNIRHLYSRCDACQKASQGQMWTTCEENITCTRNELNALNPSKMFSVNIWSSATSFQIERNSSDSRIKFLVVVQIYRSRRLSSDMNMFL